MNAYICIIIIVIVIVLCLAIYFQEMGYGEEIDNYPYFTKGNWGYKEIQKNIPKLLNAIITIESNWNNYAKSNKGCIGLMQINPKGAFKELKQYYGYNVNCWQSNLYIDDLYNPHTNIYVGTWYLKHLRDYYLKENYTIERMLAAYNGGITRLRRVNYDINKMPKETRIYIRKVMRLFYQAISSCWNYRDYLFYAELPIHKS